MPFTRLRQSLIQPNGSITGSLLGTASYAVTSSYAMNGGSGGGSTPVVSVASLNNQTILYNFSSSQEATITGLTLTNNNWGINVVEEWNSIPGDLNISSCSLLMHFSGSNNSTTFIDSSPNNVSSTVSGGAKITSSFSKFGGTSLFLGGTNGNYLTIPVVSGGPLDVNNQNFTVECYIYITATTTGIIASRYNSNAGNSGNYNWDLSITSTGKLQGIILQFNNNNSYNQITGLTTLATNTWHHIAYVKSSSLQTLFLNGNIDASGSITITTSDSGQAIRIGASLNFDGSTNAPIAGYIDEFRITKNVVRYTGSFTTSSLEFPNQLPQYETKYVGLIGGLNDTGSDYGIQKLDDTSLKIRKMSVSGTPVSGSPVLSASVDRVYVNVLNYSNVSVGSTLLGQTFTAVGSTSSYALSRSVVNAYEIVVAVDGAVQSFNNAYSVTSSTINFTENIPSGSLVDIRYLTTPNVNSASFATTASYALNSVNSLDIPKIKSIIYTNSSYTPTTASAVDLVIGNNYIIISGSNFKSSASVFIDATTGSIVSYVNENQLNVNVATKTAGTYPIYLMNTDGASTFKINAITYIAGTLSVTTKAIFGY